MSTPNTTRIHAAALTIWLLGLPGMADTSLLDLPSATMQVNWSDIKALIEQAQRPKAESQEKEEPPPIEWTVSSARYDAVAESNASIRVKAQFEIMVWKPGGWVQVPVVGGFVAPVSAALDGQETVLIRDEDGALALLLGESGPHILDMEFFVACKSEAGRVSFSFTCAPTAVTTMSLAIPVRDAQVRAPSAANVGEQRSEDGFIADLAFLSTETIEVSWALPSVLGRLKQDAPQPQPPLLTSMVSTLATVTEHNAHCESHVHFDVLRGETKSFRLLHSPEASILSVEGQGAVWRREDVDGQAAIVVQVNHDVSDGYDLDVRYESPINREAATVTLPRLYTPRDVRQTGFTGITALGAVEIEPGSEIAGAHRIDASELPVSVRSLALNPLLLAYKHTEADYLLALDIHRLEDVPVRAIAVDEVNLTTVVSEEGLAVTKAVFQVRNSIKQFLPVDLPEGAEVWGAEVNGKPVKPARDTGGEALLLPLLKSIETNRQLGAFPVSVVYTQQLEALEERLARIELKGPAVGVLADRVVWEVFLPESRRLYDSGGDLGPVEGSRLTVARLMRDSRSMQNETLYALREGIARFYVQDINNPAGALVGRDSRYTGPPLTAVAASKPNFAVAGVLPIHFDLPTEGVSQRFRTTFVAQGEAVALSLATYDARLLRVGLMALALAGLMAGAVVGRMVCRNIPTSGWAMVVSAGLAVSGVIASLYLRAGYPLWAYAGLGLALGFGGMALRQWRTRPTPDAPSHAESPQAGADGGPQQ